MAVTSGFAETERDSHSTWERFRKNTPRNVNGNFTTVLNLGDLKNVICIKKTKRSHLETHNDAMVEAHWRHFFFAMLLSMSSPRYKVDLSPTR